MFALLFAFVFLSCFVIASGATFKLNDWIDKKFGKEVSLKFYDGLCISGLLFLVGYFVFLLVMVFRGAARHL